MLLLFGFLQNSTGQLPKNKSLSTTPYKNKIVKGKKIKGQSTQAGHSNSTLDRWFLPTRHTFPGDIQGIPFKYYLHSWKVTSTMPNEGLVLFKTIQHIESRFSSQAS